jgi:hypothetical protein
MEVPSVKRHLGDAPPMIARETKEDEPVVVKDIRSNDNAEAEAQVRTYEDLPDIDQETMEHLNAFVDKVGVPSTPSKELSVGDSPPAIVRETKVEDEPVLVFHIRGFARY